MYAVAKILVVSILFPARQGAAIGVKQQWMRNMIRIMDIRIEYQGEFPRESALYLSNHRSYLDVVLVPTQVRCTVVAKQEIRSWPLIGLGSERAHVVFVDRKDPNSRVQTREIMRQRLLAGYSVLVFPEGTTHRDGIGDVKRGMFNVAADGNIPIVPVAVEYQNQDDAWVGDETFMPHFFRTARKFGGTPVKVRVGKPLQNTDPEELMRETIVWLKQACTELRHEWGTRK